MARTRAAGCAVRGGRSSRLRKANATAPGGGRPVRCLRRGPADSLRSSSGVWAERRSVVRSCDNSSGFSGLCSTRRRSRGAELAKRELCLTVLARAGYHTDCVMSVQFAPAGWREDGRDNQVVTAEVLRGPSGKRRSMSPQTLQRVAGIPAAEAARPEGWETGKKGLRRVERRLFVPNGTRPSGHRIHESQRMMVIGAVWNLPVVVTATRKILPG